MNTQQKKFKIFFLLSVLFLSAIHYDLKAQNLSTYYTFGSNVLDVRGLSIDTTGNFYFYNYDQNWNGNFSKLSGDGILSTVASGQNYHPENMIVDKTGNIFFTDMGGMWGEIKKITPEGIISDFFNNNSYIWRFTIDALDNLYFVDENTWPPVISKITPEGTVTPYFSNPNSYPQTLVFDNAGNLYFTDHYNWPMQLKKVTPDGTISTIISGNFYAENLVADSEGNIYFIDQNNWPNDIKKISPDGTVTVLVNSDTQNNPRNLTIDKFGNLYFTDYLDDQYTIRIIQNPSAPCTIPPLPVAQGYAAICYGNNILLSASGFGELRWYDAPFGGNLLNTGSQFMTPALTTNTTYYIESYFCYTSTMRTELQVTVFPPPAIVITGATTGIDSVVLTASGGVSYLWSGGKSATTAQNTFTQSGTYSVTVKNEIGCADIASTVVTINAIGLDKHGNILSGRMNNVNNHGAVGAETKVDRFGKIHDNGYDGLTAASAGASAYEIKQNFPASADGFYWIKNANINGGTPFQIYADMTTDGGGWTLIMTNENKAGWTYQNVINRNPTTPSLSTNYSIVGWADHIKKSASGFQYMIDAQTRRSYGGIWTANENYTFTKNNNSQTNVTLNTKFGTWSYHDSGIEQRMPWYSDCDGFLTTSTICNGGAWWGTLISRESWSWDPAPWMSNGCGTNGCMEAPNVIWYWVR